VVDDFTRECVALDVAQSFTGHCIARVLDHAIGGRETPATIVCDNGPEFTSKALDQCAHERGIQLHFIEPGKPRQNALAESFHRRVRDECLTETGFLTLAEAQVTLGAWRSAYNAGRPHGSLNSLTLTEFAARWFTSTSVDQP
jgi:putative transposase